MACVIIGIKLLREGMLWGFTRLPLCERAKRNLSYLFIFWGLAIVANAAFGEGFGKIFLLLLWTYDITLDLGRLAPMAIKILGYILLVGLATLCYFTTFEKTREKEVQQ